jgi:MFS family permease
MLPAKTPTETNSFKGLLRNRSFMWLWAGQAFSQVADKILLVFAIALLATSYRVPTSFSASFDFDSIIMVANTIPAIVFGAAAGIFVDRYLKQQIMVLSNLLRASLVVLLAFLPTEFVLLLLVIFAISTVTQVFTPAEQSMTPLVVPPEQLITANSLSAITQLGSIVVGYPLGTWILSQHLSDLANAIILGIIYTCAAICCQLVQSREVLAKKTGPKSYNPLPEFMEGIRYLRGNLLVQQAMMQLTIVYATIAALQVLSLKLVVEMGLEKTKFGLLVSATGIGLIIGAAIFGSWGNRLRNRPLPLVGFGIITLMLIGYILFRQLTSALLISVCLGFGSALIIVPMQTLIQEKTPASMRGKVFGFQNSAVNIALSLPQALALPLAVRFGLNAVLIVMSLAIATAGIWVWRNSRHIQADIG